MPFTIIINQAAISLNDMSLLYYHVIYGFYHQIKNTKLFCNGLNDNINKRSYTIKSSIYIDLDCTTFLHKKDFELYKKMLKETGSKPNVNLVTVAADNLPRAKRKLLQQYLPLTFINPAKLAHMINFICAVDKTNNVIFITAGRWGYDILDFVIYVLMKYGLREKYAMRLRKNKIHNVDTDRDVMPDKKANEIALIPKGDRIAKNYKHSTQGKELVVLLDDLDEHKSSIVRRRWHFVYAAKLFVDNRTSHVDPYDYIINLVCKYHKLNRVQRSSGYFQRAGTRHSVFTTAKSYTNESIVESSEEDSSKCVCAIS